jgi:hypothetical protein
MKARWYDHLIAYRRKAEPGTPWTSMNCGATSTASSPVCLRLGRTLLVVVGLGQRNGGNGVVQPDMKSAGIGAGLIGAVAVLIWLGTGFYRSEGQQAVITQFGKYTSTVGVGFNWRLPYPIQRHEVGGDADSRSMWATQSLRLQA